MVIGLLLVRRAGWSQSGGAAREGSHTEPRRVALIVARAPKAFQSQRTLEASERESGVRFRGETFSCTNGNFRSGSELGRKTLHNTIIEAAFKKRPFEKQ